MPSHDSRSLTTRSRSVRMRPPCAAKRTQGDRLQLVHTSSPRPAEGSPNAFANAADLMLCCVIVAQHSNFSVLSWLHDGTATARH
jgi:hypothetical protein